MSTTPTEKPAEVADTGIRRVHLKYPVTADGTTLNHLALRRPKVADLLHAEKRGGSDAEKEISQIASLAGVAPSVIEALDMADYLAVQKIVQAFLS
jgi:hypothetical protein